MLSRSGLAIGSGCLAAALIVAGVSLSPGWGPASAQVHQPEMENALKALGNAKQFLAAAVADKGGHREKAIALVDQAIAEVQAGIDYSE